MKLEHKIFVIGFVFMLGFMSNAVLSMEYFSQPGRYYYDGGEVVNVTFSNNKYHWDYFNGETFLKGETDYKVSIGDSIVIYDVKDALDIPFLYSPRIWREVIHNNQIIESTETHSPLILLLTTYLIVGVILLYSSFLYKKGRNATQA